MKHIYLVLLMASSTLFSSAQKYFVDSLHARLNNTREDTSRVLTLTEFGNYYAFNQFDSAIYYGRQAVDLSKKLNYDYGNYLGLKCLFFAYNTQGNYPKALEITLESVKVAEKIKQQRPEPFVSATYCLGVLNREMNNLPIAIVQLKSAIRMYKEAGVPDADMFPAYSQLALIYQLMQRFDSALWFAQRGYDLSVQPNMWKRFICLSSTVLGFIHTVIGKYDEAKKYLFIGTRESTKVNNIFFLAWNYNLLANLYKRINTIDSCIYYARISLPLWKAHNFGAFAVNASTLLAQAYELKKEPDSTIKYMKVMIAAKDSVNNQSKIKEFEKFIFDEEKRKQVLQEEQDKYRNRIKTYILSAGMFALLLVAFLLWRNNRQKQKAKKDIEDAYEELKSTQAQLVQREKMASLGEVTAGIAHEIQNPLNFVNNFSDVSIELVAELKEELNKLGLTAEANSNLQDIADDLIQNQEKINQHGKRADSIVKGMLQHSQNSSGQKELADINELADEYLRLAYHGFRAKDKKFNAKLNTDFDRSIGKIKIIPQDIGRVLLNIYNNAFYAVTEKKKSGVEGYEPAISIASRRVGNAVEITIRDNGNGVPPAIIDKIFQPFFTTKPTGQGTGLGLSLSYDILKASGGQIKVQSSPNEYSEFKILLPV